MDLLKLLQMLIDKNASDLHIIADYYPTIRIGGELFQLTSSQVITPEMSEKMILSILNNEQKELLLNNREIDLAYSYNQYRFRTNLYFSKGSICGCFRLIQPLIPSLIDLNLPAYLGQTSEYRQGLVLVTGPTGEGKSTTLASLINEINIKYTRHIITIEDPIEFTYPKGKSIVSQRELHQDTHSWSVALKSALREDPDVILVGEMRDFDTISLVLTAAETGHLVLSTLHTNSAPETIDRIIDIFPPYQQSQIRNQVASVLKMVISQRLIPKQNSNERLAAVEVLINSTAVASSIRDGKTYLINNILETAEGEGQMLFEKNLLSHLRNGLISRETAYKYALRPRELERFLRIER